MFDINAREKKTRASLTRGKSLDYLTTMGETQSLEKHLQMERNNGTKRAAGEGVTMTTVRNPRWMDSDDFFHKLASIVKQGVMCSS